MAIKPYASLETLSHFLNKLSTKFANIIHTHTKADIIDLEDTSIVAVDDNEGNVTLINATSENTSELVAFNERLNDISSKVSTLEQVIDDNNILVANENI